jgi:hypothetical protein
MAFAKNVNFVMPSKRRLSCGNASLVQLHPVGGLRGDRASWPTTTMEERAA